MNGCYLEAKAMTQYVEYETVLHKRRMLGEETV